MNKWIVVGALVLLGAWGPFLYAELTSEEVEKKTRDLPSAHDDDDDEPVEFLPPEEEEEEEEPAEPEPEPEVALPEAPVPAAEPAEPIEGEAEQQGEEGGDAPPPPPPASGPTGVLKQAFESEPRDALWASETERRIGSLFAGDELPDDMLQGASCRKTVCQIELRWAPDNAEAYMKAAQLMGEQFGGQIGVEPAAEVAEDGVQQVFVYVLREGYDLQDLAE